MKSLINGILIFLGSGLILWFFITTVFGIVGFLEDKKIISNKKNIGQYCGPSNFNFLILFWIGFFTILFYKLHLINFIFLAPMAYILNTKIKMRAFSDYLIRKGYYGDELLVAILQARLPYTVGLFKTIFWYVLLCLLIIKINGKNIIFFS